MKNISDLDINGSNIRSKFSACDIFFIAFLEISIDRKNLVKTTLAEFSNKPLKDLKKKIRISFTGEHGTDGGKLFLFLSVSY